jgi:hypothetical protein
VSSAGGEQKMAAVAMLSGHLGTKSPSPGDEKAAIALDQS